jgi:dCTP diphosphatase
MQLSAKRFKAMQRSSSGKTRPRDNLTTIGHLKEVVAIFNRERDWVRYHNPKDVSIAMSVEASELLNLFKWEDGQESTRKLKTKMVARRFREELADVLIFALTLANVTHTDLSTAVQHKLRMNERKYPAGKRKRKL